MTYLATTGMALWYLLPFGVRDVLARAFKTALTTSIPAYFAMTAAHVPSADLLTVLVVGASAAGTVILNAVLIWARK